jgi:predicted anti-sigma-YlaC factor YlaD
VSEHERIRILLPLAASGDLSPRDMRRVDEHVARCAECRKANVELAALASSLRALPTPQPPAELVARVCRLGTTRLELQRTPRNGTAFLAPLVAASWVAALATWPLVRTEFHWLFGGWHVPAGGLAGTVGAYSILGFVLACASALAVGMSAREIRRSK